jgi:phage terminase small subunit
MSPKQLLFCHCFAKNDFMNGKAAAIAAGYSERSAVNQASMMLRMPEIKAYVEDMKKQRNQLVTADATMVVNGYTAIATANPLDCLVLGSDGLWKGRSPDQLPKAVLPAIARIHIRTLKAKDGKEYQEFKYELHDKMAALLQLGRHLDVFGEDDPSKRPVNIAMFANVPSEQLEALNAQFKALMAPKGPVSEVGALIEGELSVAGEI